MTDYYTFILTLWGLWFTPERRTDYDETVIDVGGGW